MGVVVGWRGYGVEEQKRENSFDAGRNSQLIVFIWGGVLIIFAISRREIFALGTFDVPFVWKFSVPN